MDARTIDTVQADTAVPSQLDESRSWWRDAVPVVLTLLALGVADAHYGAFTIDRWAPLAVFVLLVLAIVAPGRQVPSGARGPLIAICAFAAWSMLSLTWAQVPGAAFEGGARNALLAGLFALPVLTLRTARTARLAADVLVGVLAVLVAGTLVAYLVDPGSLFLAGRLEAPIAYRNGTAVLFAMAFWPLICVAASRRVRFALRPGALALATLAAGFAFLTQSRGVLIGTAAGGIVALGLGPERIRRAWVAIVAVAPVALVSHRLLQPYDTFSVAYKTLPSALTDARGALLLAAAVGLAGGLVIALLDHRAGASRRGRMRRLAVAGLVLASLGGAVLAVDRIGDPVQFVRDKSDEFTTSQSTGNGSTRLGSVGGQRYDLWRVAVREWRERPELGVGEGSYAAGYYRYRHNDRNVVAAHSLPFGTLAELGLVGLLLLLAFVTLSILGLARLTRAAPPADRRRIAALAACATVFLGQSIVDWFWTIPGLSGLALIALGIALTLAGDADRPAPQTGRLRRALPAAVCVVLALVAAGQFLAERDVLRARAATDQQVRLDRARAAARLNPFARTPRYIEAGALEALGRPGEARQTLLDQLEREPKAFVTSALLGDLETRQGNLALARAWYRRALFQNPLDTGLAKLARNPTP